MLIELLDAGLVMMMDWRCVMGSDRCVIAAVGVFLLFVARDVCVFFVVMCAVNGHGHTPRHEMSQEWTDTGASRERTRVVYSFPLWPKSSFMTTTFGCRYLYCFC
jgi:hypothetical protein